MGDFEKLAMPDDNGVIITGGNTGAQLFAPVLFKVALSGNQNISRRIKLEPFRRPLLGDMVGYDNKGICCTIRAVWPPSLPQSFQTFCPRRPRAQQRIAAVQDMGNRIW